MIIFKQLQDDNTYERIGAIENGEFVEGGDLLRRFVHPDDLDDEQALLERHDGPHVVATKPDETETAKVEMAKALAEAIAKERIYVDHPSEAPEGADVQEGPRGGIYYEGEGDEGTQQDPLDEQPARDDNEEDTESDREYVPDPETDIPRFREDETTTEQVAEANEGPGGGFTFRRNLDTYDFWSDDAWFVGMKSVEIPAEEGVEKEDVVEFYKEHVEALEAHPATRVGGYHFDDGTKISIDFTVALTDRDEAEELGRKLNQESVFNPVVAVEEGFDVGSIETGGDSDSPLETAEDIKEQLANIKSLKKALLGAFREVLRKMTTTKDVNMTAQFKGVESGRVLTRKRLFRIGLREGGLSEDGDGYVLNGERYTPVEADAE